MEKTVDMIMIGDSLNNPNMLTYVMLLQTMLYSLNNL